MPSKKKSFFGVFQEVNTNDDDELEEEPAKFKFNRDSKSIKDHFAVERKKKKSEKKLDVAGIEESPKKCAKRKSRKNSPNDKDQNASEEEEIDKIQNKKKTFFGVFKDGNQDQQVEKEEVRFKFHTNITDEIDKSCSSPKKSSQDKKSQITEKNEKKSWNSNKKTSKDNVVCSISPRKTLARNRRSIAKMMTMSQSYSATEDIKSPKKSAKAKPKISVKKSSKKKCSGLTKINSVFKAISVDDLLKLPETVGDTGLTMDEILDKVDLEIKEQQSKYEAEMKILDQTIEKQREKKAALEKRMNENSILRDRLTTGLTKSALKELFEKNIPYLTDIREGRIVSARHNSFHKDPQSRQDLLYRMITHPFTDEQVDWTYDEFRSRWMKTTKQFHEFNEYMWKVIYMNVANLAKNIYYQVLLPECFIKFYMDFFQFTKEEAEIRIKETPMVDDLND